MDNDRYEDINRSADYKVYSFVSAGKNGNLTKLVKFSPFDVIPNTCNLALGTVRNDEINFIETTDNDDRNKILATIFYIAKNFSDAYPNQKIFFRGRNEVTNRLYRGAINHGYQKLILDFIIYGGIYQSEEDRYNFEQFNKNKKYDSFLFYKR